MLIKIAAISIRYFGFDRMDRFEEISQKTV